MDIILIGAQGSGKGTQAGKLAQALGISHIASGDLFRDIQKETNELGLQVKSYLDKGELVPDELTINMVLARIAQPDCRPGVLLDGFPRTLPQAAALDQRLHSVKRHIGLAIFIDVPRAQLLSRLSGRLICRAHQHVYNVVTNPPKQPGICNFDGSALYQRADDTGEAIQKRLDIFFNETIHLLDYYKRQHKLVTINGSQEIEHVQQDILQAAQNIVARQSAPAMTSWRIFPTPGSTSLLAGKEPILHHSQENG